MINVAARALGVTTLILVPPVKRATLVQRFIDVMSEQNMNNKHSNKISVFSMNKCKSTVNKVM